MQTRVSKLKSTEFVYAGECELCHKFFTPDSKGVYMLSKDKKWWGNGLNEDSICAACSRKE